MLKFTFLLTLFFSQDSFAALCKQWSSPQKVGALDTSLLMEASGTAPSRAFPGRYYHHNDSGDGAFFYITDSVGAQTQKVQFDSDMPTDIEDMSIGKCTEGTCLYFGDIGDNAVKRKDISVWIVPELEAYPGNRSTARMVRMVYPDGPHNAESLAIHPSTGDLYILTKEFSFDERRAYVAHLYMVRAQDLAAYVAGSLLQLRKVSDIDLPFLNYDFGLFGQQATAMDISPDGQRLLVLTYQNVVEIDLEKALAGESRNWSEGVDYSTFRMFGLLSQMEAISYGLDGKSFRVEGEFNPDSGDKEAAIFEVRCEDGR